MKERIYYFDVAKGFLILMLLMYHLGIAMGKDGLDNSIPYLIPWYYPQTLFLPFFMQCFFIISGYCSNQQVGIKTFLLKLVRQLLIPCIFFEVIRILFFVIQGKPVTLFSGSELTSTSIWFLNALIFAKLICYSLHHIAKNDYIVLFLLFIILVVGVMLYRNVGKNVFFYQHGMIAAFFFEFGSFLKRNHRYYDIAIKYSWPLFLIIVSGRFLHLYELPFFNACISVTIPNLPFFVIVSILGSFSLLYLSKVINRNRFFEYFGRNSLVIYGIHMWPYLVIIKLMYIYIGVSSFFSTILFLASICIIEIICMILAIELLNTKYLKYMIGR